MLHLYEIAYHTSTKNNGIEYAACLGLRDRPFLFPGTRVERIYENLKKSFIPHVNTINIFRNPLKSV